jgi:hypothetical protein
MARLHAAESTPAVDNRNEIPPTVTCEPVLTR